MAFNKTKIPKHFLINNHKNQKIQKRTNRRRKNKWRQNKKPTLIKSSQKMQTTQKIPSRTQQTIKLRHPKNIHKQIKHQFKTKRINLN